MPKNKEAPTHYDTLKISKNSSCDDIKKAYRKLALKHHPDKNPEDYANATERFKRIREAYETLTNNNKRATYDAALAKMESNENLTQYSYVPHPVFTPVEKNAYVEAIALTAHLNYTFVKECYDNQSDGRFERVKNLAYYLAHHRNMPSLSLDEAFATTLQESINLRRAFPLIADGFITINIAKKLSDQQSENISGIGTDVVRKGLLTLQEVLGLSPIENEILYQSFTHEGKYNLNEAVASLRAFQNNSTPLRIPDEAQRNPGI